jgi:hypothetical protein
MTTYNEDLLFAQNILKCLKYIHENKSFNGLMVETNNRGINVYLKKDKLLALSISYSFDETPILDGDSHITEEQIIIDYRDTVMSVYTVEGRNTKLLKMKYPVLQYSEELYFQYSTIYTEAENQLILLAWYLKLEENRLPDITRIDLFLDELPDVFKLILPCVGEWQ